MSEQPHVSPMSNHSSFEEKQLLIADFEEEFFNQFAVLKINLKPVKFKGKNCLMLACESLVK